MLHFALGVVVGTLICMVVRFIQTGTGVLRIDHSDPEKDVYRLEIDNLDKISKKKELRVHVDNNADLSQK